VALNFTTVFVERGAAFFPFGDDVAAVFFTDFALVTMESPY